MDNYWVYIMTNQRHTVLYTGMTNDLKRRVEEHKEKNGSNFTRTYNVDKLIFFERFSHPEEAILAEKKIKGGSRAKKILLIEGINPQWKDLYDEIK